MTPSFRFGLVVALLSMLTGSAAAQVRFANLSKQEIQIATLSYQAAKTSLPAAKGTKPGSIPEGYRYSGWTSLAAGTSQELASGSYYLRQAGAPVTWPNLPATNGLIKMKGEFSVFVPKAKSEEEFKDLQKQGFKQAAYLTFEKGTYTYGSDLRLESQTFKFNFASTAKMGHKSSYSVPGRIVYYDVNVSAEKTASFKWSQDASQVTVSGTTEGGPLKVLRGKDKSYYNGTVTINFIR